MEDDNILGVAGFDSGEGESAVYAGQEGGYKFEVGIFYFDKACCSVDFFTLFLFSFVLDEDATAFVFL